MGATWRGMTTGALAAALLALGQPDVPAADESAYPAAPTATIEQAPQRPQGPGPAAAPPKAVPDIVGYKPIPESALPIAGAPAGALKTQEAHTANLPGETNLGGPALTMGPYTLGPDDVVHIAVSGQPDFTGQFVVGQDGMIQYSYLGDVAADGLTKDELATVLAEKLTQYVRVPTVTVTIVGFNSKAIYILGRVARPGKYAMRGDTIKIRDAVIAAGLVIRHAKLRKVHIVKSDPTDPSYRVVDLQKVLYKGKMQENVDLVTGDIVVIPTTVWGAVNDFLSELISPASHAGRAAALAAL